jgi:hypothetical protein
MVLFPELGSDVSTGTDIIITASLIVAFLGHGTVTEVPKSWLN